MSFWDSSAVIALLFEETRSRAVGEILRRDRQLHVWWGTELECVSAIARHEREGLDGERVSDALQRLSRFRQEWIEVLPSPGVRDTAKRLLRVHPLRAADALQLAAAIALEGSRDFLSLDDRLRVAASREGFAVLP